MRTWLFVFAVLATFNGCYQVASTEEVKKSSSSAFSSFSPKSSLATDSTSSSIADSSSSNVKSNKYNSYDNDVELSDRIESDNYRRGDKPDPQTLVQIEKNLLSLFGFERRPKVDRSKVVIPEAMKKLYAQITGHELEMIDEPKADLHSREANTVRSFTHEGEFSDNFALFNGNNNFLGKLLQFFTEKKNNFLIKSFKTNKILQNSANSL
jgi:hypothetical protein